MVRLAASRLSRAFACAALAVAGCGGGGGDGAAQPPRAVTLSGVISFDLVPVVAGVGLDYPATTARPARGVAVELLSGATVLASTFTDSAGAYSFDVAPNTEVMLRVRAEMVRAGAPAWNVRVLDNTSADALYVLSGTPFNTGFQSSIRDVNAASGWSGSSYAGARSAAPFAILDVIYDGLRLVTDAAPNAVFPPLVIYWSPSNVPVMGAGGEPNPATGEIGSSFYSSSRGIYILGAADDDTDEYDRHVVAHEWGHYIEDVFSRADSMGGPHTLSDQLDMRVAFGEGFGNAFSAMVTGQNVYRDAAGPGQSQAFGFDIEGPLLPGRPNPNPGWYNEESVQEFLYDLFDPANADPIAGTTVLDQLDLGFPPIFEVLTGQHRDTPALTSLFTFVNGLKALRPADAPLIDAQIGAQRVAQIVDDYGSAETNFGVPESPDLQSVYSTAVVGGAPVTVCSLEGFGTDHVDNVNKLGPRRFVRFTVSAPGVHVLTARAVEQPAASDPDMFLHRAGVGIESTDAPSVECTDTAPEQCVESLTTPALDAGEYVLEVYEWTNTNENDHPEHPPIGRTCFAVTVTRQ